MNALARCLTFAKLRFEVWWSCIKMRRAVVIIMRMSAAEAGPVLTKWKWDASQIKDVELRDKMLDMVALIERSRKKLNEL